MSEKTKGFRPPIILAGCVAVNVPGMMLGIPLSWVSGVFCALVFFAIVLSR